MFLERDVKVSIIIVAYIEQAIVENCLASIYEFNDIGDALEVIVVDNSPNDNKLDDSVKLKYPNIVLIKNNNLGFGQGNNVGARQSRGKYLFFLNPDTILVEPILSYAYDRLEKDSSIAMLGFQLIDTNKNKNHSFFFVNTVGIFGTIFFKIISSLGIYIDKFMFISGANMFMPKSIFYEIGMFDENIFMYCEEQDLTHRIHEIGKKTSFCRSKNIIHLEGGTTSSNPEIALRRRIDSMEYYCQKYNKDFNCYLKKEIKINSHKLYIARILRHSNIEKFTNNIKVISEYL